MFYSHEILTRREHGVATIWLVATLGSKSSLKKVTRKAINDVDVPKAVETIVSPDAPMALRLQGNLLYGISRVYSQQCSYVHQDLQNFWDKLRHSSLVFASVDIDLETGRARPDQLNLQDDPAFMPDLDINLDLSLFDLPLERSFSRASSQLPSLAGSSHASLSDHEPQLKLPSEETSSLGIGGFDLGAGTSSAGGVGGNIGGPSIFEEPGIIDDPDFDIDADGNLFTPTQRQHQSNLAQGALATLGVPGSKAGDSTGITDRVRDEHEAGIQAHGDDQAFEFDDPGILMGDDDLALPDAVPFSARRASSAPAADRNQCSASAHPDTESSSVIEVVPQRRGREKPPIKVDEETQLRNEILKTWDTDYLVNMTTERQKHAHFTSTLTQAKKKAEYLVLGMGLSGLGREFGDDLDHPLRQAFGGQDFFNLLTGKHPSPFGKKRSHISDEEDEEVEQGRRARQRSDEELMLGRGGSAEYQFDDGDGILARDDDVPIEVGRQAPSSLPDIDSIRHSMPWNVLASSRAGSARPGPFTSSAGGAAVGFEPLLGPPSSRDHGHRFTSASPLFGRGKQGAARYSRLEILDPARELGGTDTFDDLRLPDMGDEDFELHGPAAAVSTQQANNSQWLAKTLEDESNNFFDFLRAEIELRYPVLGKTESQELGSDESVTNDKRERLVTFEELLPPEANSKVVGAQGLLHVLTLVTRRVLTVKQEVEFGEIEIGVVDGARVVDKFLDEEGDEMMDEGKQDEVQEGDDEDMYG